MDQKTLALKLLNLAVELLADAPATPVVAAVQSPKLLEHERLAAKVKEAGLDPEPRRILPGRKKAKKSAAVARTATERNGAAKRTRQPRESTKGGAVRDGSVTDGVGKYLSRIGLRQEFSTKELLASFGGDVSATGLSMALGKWINEGYVERVSQGNRWTPSTYRKVRAMENED